MRPYAGFVEYPSVEVDSAEIVASVLNGKAPGLTVRTAGSTGTPRHVRIGSKALEASATAGLERLGGPGSWLLALPHDRIAGINVWARAHVGGKEVVVMEPGPFQPERFIPYAQTTLRLPGRHYVSLVPTQVRRLVKNPDACALLDEFDAVLVGGAALDSEDRRLNVVESYGMTETTGGCVFDGVPLDGVDVAVDSHGLIFIGGDTLADGYVDGKNDRFTTLRNRRYFATKDVGALAPDLTIVGRADTVIITGGINVYPEKVAGALRALEYITEACVVPIPDVEWGHTVAAVVVTTHAVPPSLEEVRHDLAHTLEPHERPRHIAWVERLPMLESGKIDHEAAVAIATGAGG